MRESAVILGGGGHGRVVFDILEQAGEVDIVGFTSATPGQTDIFGYRCLGTDENLGEIYRRGVRCAFVAVGDNARRRNCLDVLKEHGFRIINAVSPRATVSRHAVLGCGVAVMPGAVINGGAQIADGVIVNTNASVDHDCKIGAYVHVAPGVTIAGDVCVGQGAFLGAGSCVIPGITIGFWTTIGAGAVVVRDVPDEVVAIGVPATIARSHIKRLA